MNITFPSDTKKIIDAIRTAIGREVIFVTNETPSGCTASGCSLDPIANTSTNSFCTVCSGNYWIPVYIEYTISGHITWNPSDILNWQSAGQLFDGEVRVQIEYTDTNIHILDITDHVILDNRIMEIKKKFFRGVKPINRILIDLIEKERE